jgi:hypothetical protein
MVTQLELHNLGWKYVGVCGQHEVYYRLDEDTDGTYCRYDPHEQRIIDLWRAKPRKQGAK